MKRTLTLFTAFLGSALHGAAYEEKVIQCSEGKNCHVYTPNKVDPDKTYQLIVGVHGAGRGTGKGAAHMAKWADRGDVIVIGPSWNTQGYQMGDGVHAQKLIKLFDKLKKNYKLQDKMFIHGFSGGSQFGHRFAMLHPQYVCGVSAHSGGSWATDNYGSISSKAKHIPFAISCGEADTGFSFKGAKYGRLKWYQVFEKEMEKKGMCFIGGTWPKIGHKMCPQAWELTKQCFQLATGLPGESAKKTVKISDAWKNLDGVPKKSADTDDAKKPPRPYVDPAQLARMTKAAFAQADANEIPNNKLVSFMEKYPPVLWKDKEGSAKLLEQCERAATNWKKSAERAGRFNGEVKRKFKRFANGLEAAKAAK